MTSKYEKKLAEFDTRDKQQNIYGVKTMKQKRIEEDLRQAGPEVPSFSSKTENKLLLEAGANPYDKVTSTVSFISSIFGLIPLFSGTPAHSNGNPSYRQGATDDAPS